MIDHLGIHVSDLDRAIAFYTAALAPLGYTLVMKFEQAAGFGPPGKPELWLSTGTPQAIHVAIRTKSRADVRAFHAAALAAGGTDHGAPGVRTYHPDYYAAFVLDADGHNLEAVCHEPYLG